MPKLFVAIEGIDGAGCSTQTEELKKRLERAGYKVRTTKEPTKGPIGKLIRAYLKKRGVRPEVYALLFAADRLEDYLQNVEGADDATIVISDRYIESSIAYQGASGVDVEWIETLNKFVTWPDVTIILDVDPEVSLARKGLRENERDVFEEAEFLSKVRRIFLERAKKKKYYVVDASQPLEKVAQKIFEIVVREIHKAEGEHDQEDRDQGSHSRVHFRKRN